MFEKLNPLAPDAIIGIMALFRQDTDHHKVDLSVGVYQDENGQTPILECVKRAERELIDAQKTKTYVGIAGNMDFNLGMENLLFGAEHPAIRDGRVATLQSPGGSGGLCVAAHLLRRANPDTCVWLSDPSWPNHTPLLRLAGLTLEQYPYYDRARHAIDFEAMLASLERCEAGDVTLIHGCCHNPCGADLSQDQWLTLADLCERRGIVPFIDLAYQGLSEGLEQDAYGVRLMAERVPEVVVVASCSKNLGMYRERVGSVSVVSRNSERAKVVASNLANVARGIYSMPPDHGAAIAGRILQSDELRGLWVQELDVMRWRLNSLRELLVAKLAERNSPIDFSFIARERGMFSFLGLERERVIDLRERFHVYMVESSRINVAGINQANVDYVADSIVSIL